MNKERSLAIEELVCSLQGVDSARVVLDPNGEITELHILSDQSRNPRLIVRDTETLLLVRLGINIDHKRISVVQFAERPEAEVKRINLRGISYKLNRGAAEVGVTLTLGDKQAECTVSGPNSLQNQLRLVASATVGALRDLLGNVVGFVVEDVTQFAFARGEVVVVGVSVVSGTGEETLVGSAFVRSDAKEAVVKATLDGVNRRCQRYFGT